MLAFSNYYKNILKVVLVHCFVIFIIECHDLFKYQFLLCPIFFQANAMAEIEFSIKKPKQK